MSCSVLLDAEMDCSNCSCSGNSYSASQVNRTWLEALTSPCPAGAQIHMGLPEQPVLTLALTSLA